MWDDHIAPLGDAGFDVQAIDLPGFGDNPLPTQGEVAHWDAVLDAIGDVPAVLVGNSFGAAVALRAAVFAPERVSAMMLVSAPVDQVPLSAQIEAAWAAEEEALERGDVDAAVRAVVEAWAPANLHERVGQMQRRAFELQMDSDLPRAPDPLEETLEPLRTLDIPALIAYGENEMPDFKAGAELLAGELPDARLHVFQNAGHLAPLETPGEFREVLLSFLRSV